MPTTEPVLVVDDTAAFREMVSAILSKRGFRVATASNGREGIDWLLAALEPHTVLLDIVMPVLDGISMLREMRTDPRLNAAGHHVILMSTSKRLAGVDVPPAEGHLPKPFTPQQLITAVLAAQAR